MNAHTEGLVLSYPRMLTVVVAVALAGGIALANMSSDRVTFNLVMKVTSRPERAYGWPVRWYWRQASTVRGTIPPWNGLPARRLLEWPIVRYSESGLIVDLATWLLLLTVSSAGCQRVLRKLQPRPSWRPRLTTFIILPLIAAPVVLANMTFGLSYAPPQRQFGTASFGWPFVWHWYWVAPWQNIYGHDFGAAPLAGNVVVWLATLVLAALLWEWLLRRYAPRLRFSLRTMLAAVLVAAFLCAWCAAIWRRSREQDTLPALGLASQQLWVERPGPRWFRLVLPDRYRRKVVGASLSLGRWPEEQEGYPDDSREEIQDGEYSDDNALDTDDEFGAENEARREEEVLRRLGHLSALRLLEIHCGTLTPGSASALAKLDHLKSLSVTAHLAKDSPSEPANLLWVAHLRQLEEISLAGTRSDDLVPLTDLKRLKSLTLNLTDCGADEPEMDRRLSAVGKLAQLHRLRLQGSPGAQIAHLSGLANLKSLAIDFHHFDGDDERLRQCFAAIGTLEQVQVLRLVTPSGPLRVSADNLASLRGMKNLTSLSLLITCDKAEKQRCLAALAELTQLRRLWLEGDLVTTGLAELAPLELLEELLISDRGMETPTAIESLSALKGLKAIYIPSLASDLLCSTDEAVSARRALELFQRSHAGRVHNLRLEWENDFTPWGHAQLFADEPPDANSFWQYFDEEPPDLDSFLGGNPAGP